VHTLEEVRMLFILLGKSTTVFNAEKEGNFESEGIMGVIGRNAHTAIDNVTTMDRRNHMMTGNKSSFSNQPIQNCNSP
jgi:hypothetical protein